jgi:hypothetical protein
MWKVTTAMIAVLALGGPAMAFGPNGTIQPNIPDDGRDTSTLNGVTIVDVQCYPSFDPRDHDRDPVTHTDIDLTFQPHSDFLIQSFVVNHNLASRRVINRDTQYAGTTWKKPGFNEWHWEGRQYDNPRMSMLATLLRTARGEWRYQEVIYKDGRVDHVIPAMQCRRVLAGNEDAE